VGQHHEGRLYRLIKSPSRGPHRLAPSCVCRPTRRQIRRQVRSSLVVRARTFATINSSSEVSPCAISSCACPTLQRITCGRLSAPGSRPSSYAGLGTLESCTVRSNSARAVVPLSNPPRSRASRAPLITLPYSQGYPSSHLRCRTRFRFRATRPFQFYPSRTPFPRALCAARLNTQLSSIDKAAHP
jgi:hypothetical protein